MSQLIFKFPFKTKYYEQDFYVSQNNFSAYKLIESWPNWPGKWLNIFGDHGSGKTHLSKILEKKIDSIDSIYVQEFNKKNVFLKIKYLGKLDKIMKQLEAQRIILKLIGDQWSLKLI